MRARPSSLPAAALLLLLALAPPLRADLPAVTVPAEVKGEAGDFIRVAGATDAKGIQWVALTPGLRVFPPELLRDSKTAVVIAVQDGTYKLLAYAGNAEGASVPVYCTVTVGTPAPVPPPGNGFTPTLAAAWAQEAAADKAAAAAKLAAVYQAAAMQGPGGAYDPALSTCADLLASVHAGAASLIADRLPAVRKALGAELSRRLPTDPAAKLDTATRALCASQFQRMAALLRGLK